MTHPYPESLQHEDVQLAEHSRGFLWPGETLTGVFPMGLDGLIRGRLPRRYRAAKPGEGREAGFWRVLAPVYWVFGLPAYLLESAAGGTCRGIWRLFRGKVRAGGWESGAGHFIRAVRNGPSYDAGYDNDRYLLAFTDRRLLLLTEPSTLRSRPPQLLAELPRGQFALRREPHPPRHKDRVDIAFPDGSWAALDAGHRIQVEQIAYLLG
ncbi:hypothetical protein [Streptomyces sp. NPDC050738]|uniref:hypothetical protein n=1 Tax=Streptomyces sp. NPDC050738 TaxID=3154744 RepID=UPI0034121C53